MPSVNFVEIIGHLGADPKITTTQSNQKVANFSIATTKKWKDKEQNWNEKTEWHRIIAWRWMAERAERDLKKGSLCRVTGKIKQRKYTKDGTDHYVTEILAESVQCFDKKPKKGAAPDSGSGEGMATGTFDESGNITPDDPDLPF